MDKPADIGALTAAELATLTYPGTDEPVATLADLFGTVLGRVPLFVELKSQFDGDTRLAKRVAELVSLYDGPLALQSFDALVLDQLRSMRIGVPLGLIARAHYAPQDWPELSQTQRFALARTGEVFRAKPDFLAWKVDDLPHVTPLFARARGVPVLAWTVRSEAQRQKAKLWADQIVFEGFAL